MRKTKMNTKDISIRMIIIASFIVVMLTTVGVIGYIVFSNWITSAKETITIMAKDMNDEIYNEIDTFIDIPGNINQINKGLIENGIVDLKNESDRERFFVEVLKNYSNDVYSFSYGSESGEYYGARRNKDNIIEIMKNNVDTNGNSWYYSVKDDMTSGERVVDAGKFDPRTRDWYKAAKKTRSAVFSPIYKHFFMDDLTVSAAVPIYNEVGALKGVLGSHITLSRINSYLKGIVKDKNAFAVIIEKESGELIANSIDKANFTTNKDGSIKRMNLDEIDNEAITNAYKNYKSTGNSNFRLKNKSDTLDINLKEYHKDGLEWIVITAVPESLFTASIAYNVKLVVMLILLSLILSIVFYLNLTNKLFRPIDKLIDINKKFTLGDFTQRAVVARDDEVGRLSISFNKMANTISMLVNNLEIKVKERTIELEESNNIVIQNKDQLQLILDSTAEGIYGIDINGNCTFINASGLEILGYKHQDELIGKNVHLLIHHTYRNGTQMPIGQCEIFKSFMLGKASHVEDEVFWRKDSTKLEVEYYSYPQYKGGAIIGAVVTFMDNTQRKKNEKNIKYLSYHDSLTGLNNRMFFEDEFKKLDTNENIPISIIFGDVNGLKLTNDIFGHAAGDELLKKAAAILKKVCGKQDIVARMGGDEFAIFLPNTESIDAESIMDRIRKELSKEKVVAIKASISMGYATKTSLEQDIERIMVSAEERMYKDKLVSRKTINSEMIKTIIERLHNKSDGEKRHSINVSEICESIGKAMKIPETEVKKLKEAGYLHDIGKIVLDENSLKKDGTQTMEENKEIEQHAAVGFRILNLFDETLDLAEGILSHHENWDGSGYPKGLRGEEIPMLARIIRVADGYDEMMRGSNKNAMGKEKVLNEIRRKSGIIFDPDIVDIFIKL